MEMRVPSWLAKPFVWSVLPFAWWWARGHERKILREGRELTAEEKSDAAAAGVDDVESMRIRVIAPVPTPGGRLLRGAAMIARFPIHPPAGMATNGQRVARHDANQRGRNITEISVVRKKNYLDPFGGADCAHRSVAFVHAPIASVVDASDRTDQIERRDEADERTALDHR